ncbi:MAG: universal stress protein [Microscillaceae bacterium]|nr:universal stress protein [Microscillaceae bacterium]
MKKILVPTDFSPYSHNALKIAIQFARKTDAEITVLHVIPPVLSDLLAPDTARRAEVSNLEHEYIRGIHEFARQELEKVIAHENYPINKIHIYVEGGIIPQSITQLAEEIQVDLIIMGTQGTNPIEEIFVGSNTEKVVRMASCPVLAVRDKHQNFILAKILFATDLKQAQPAAMTFIRKLQRLFDGEIHLLYINSAFGFLSSEEIERRKEHFVLAAKLDNYHFHIVNAKTEEAGILVTAQKIDADLIALTTHQRRGLAHFFLGSTAEDIVNHANRPVLTLGTKMEEKLMRNEE